MARENKFYETEIKRLKEKGLTEEEAQEAFHENISAESIAGIYGSFEDIGAYWLSEVDSDVPERMHQYIDKTAYGRDVVNYEGSFHELSSGRYLELP